MYSAPVTALWTLLLQSQRFPAKFKHPCITCTGWPLLKPGLHLWVKHDTNEKKHVPTCEINSNTSEINLRKRNMFLFFLVPTLMLISLLLCLHVSHKQTALRCFCEFLCPRPRPSSFYPQSTLNNLTLFFLVE